MSVVRVVLRALRVLRLVMGDDVYARDFQMDDRDGRLPSGYAPREYANGDEHEHGHHENGHGHDGRGRKP